MYVPPSPSLIYSTRLMATQVTGNSQSDIAWSFTGCYGELEGQHDCHADGHWNDQLDDLLRTVTKCSLQQKNKSITHK